jgi:thioredoxin-related protein
MRLLLALALLAVFPAKSAESWEAFFSPFLGDLRAELDDAKRAGRKGVVVMYHFEACPYCKRMKDEVLLRRDVQEGYRKDFVALAIDTRGAQPITGLDGRTHPESAFAREQKVRGTPTFDFFGADGERLYRHVGGIFDPAEFLLLGRYVASGAHRTLSFAQYKQQIKGSWEKFFTPGLGDFRAEAADARAQGKHGIVFVYQQDPCPYCERMKANVLARPDVQAWYGERFAAYSIDVRGSVEMIDFAGLRTTEGRYAREALVRGAPTLDFYDLDGALLARVPGEIPDWQTFLALGEWVASGERARQTFDKYRAARGLGSAPLKLNVLKP